jgi:hypothetical protein
MVMRVGSFFPFQTTYYLNGHSFIEQELTRAQVGFKNDNAFLAIDDVAALQTAADRSREDVDRCAALLRKMDEKIVRGLPRGEVGSVSSPPSCFESALTKRVPSRLLVVES